MINRSKQNHASLAGHALPATTAAPPAEEQTTRRTLREAVEALGILPLSDDEPLRLDVAKTLAVYYARKVVA